MLRYIGPRPKWIAFVPTIGNYAREAAGFLSPSNNAQ